MSITLDLQPEVERRLRERAEAKGVSLTDYARDLLVRDAGSGECPVEATSLYELFAPVRGLLTDEEIERIFARDRSEDRPIDLA